MFAGLKQQFLKAGVLPGRLTRKEPPPPTRTGKGAKATKAAPTERAGSRYVEGFRRFIRENKSELRKVAWPSREQTTNLTVIVIAVSAAVGLFMGGVDLVFKAFFQLLLGAR